MLVDVRGHQRRVGSSLAAKKADAVVKISFARRNSAFSARSFFSSAIASSADCLVSSATVASDWSRQRRSDSGAIPRSFATAEIAFVSDEYEERDSASSLTAFALNSGVYRVPFAMVPSSPIESEEMRNKNQFISMKSKEFTNHQRKEKIPLDKIRNFRNHQIIIKDRLVPDSHYRDFGHEPSSQHHTCIRHIIITIQITHLIHTAEANFDPVH